MYGNAAVQIVSLVVEVTTSFTTRINVATESHPVELVVVNVYVPASVYCVPFQVYGNADVQIVSVVVEVTTSFTTNIKVARESQPVELIVVNVYVPAAVYSVPFQVYGNADVQIVSVVVDVTTSFTTKIKVATESQPVELIVVKVYVPASVYSVPFQLNGRAEVQIVSVVGEVTTSFTTKIKVATESQPVELVVVNV